MQLIDSIEFNSELVEETTFNVTELGEYDCKMELYKQDETTYSIEWDIPELDRTVYIGIWIDNEQFKNVIDYDGVFELPNEAIELLVNNQFNTQAVE